MRHVLQQLPEYALVGLITFASTVQGVSVHLCSPFLAPRVSQFDYHLLGGITPDIVEDGLGIHRCPGQK